MADIFDVLADATRRDLLQALLDKRESANGDAGELSVGEMVELLELSQPTVSKHLRVLRDNHLVRVREVGQHRYYRLDPSPLDRVEDWLVPFLVAAPGGRDDAGIAMVALPGGRLPTPLRLIAEGGPAAGASLGRAAAGASFRSRALIGGVSTVPRGIAERVRRLLRR